MKRPPILTFIAIVQLFFASAGFLVAITFAFEGFPPWFGAWCFIVSFMHLISAIQILRLRWSGPVIGLSALIGAFIVGQFLLGPQTTATPVKTVVALVIMGLYAIAIYQNRAVFAPNNSFKPSPLRGPGKDS